MENKIFDFEYQGIKYYYIRNRKADRVRVEKDKDGKDKFVGIFNCTKCGGAGQGGWRRDNGICYDCHGLGYYTIILNTTKNISTAERRIKADKEKKERQQDENRKKMLEDNLRRNLYKYSEIFYIILDTLEHSTYNEREYLKSKGARWNPDWDCWYVKKYDNVESDFKDFQIYEIPLEKVMNENNWISWTTIRGVVLKYKDWLESKRGVEIV